MRLETDWKRSFAFLALSYSSKIMAIHIIRGLLHPWKKRPDMLSEGNAALPVGCDSTLQIVMAVWRPFCLNSNFLGRVWQPSADNNGALKGHYYLQRAVTPNQITQQNSCKGKETPKGRKGTLGPDFQANTRPRNLFLKPMSPQDTWRQVWGYPGIVSLRQFRDNEAWIPLGQESPLMNKKGLGYPVCLASNQNVPTCTYMLWYTALVFIVRPAQMRSSVPLLEPGPPRFFGGMENNE